MVDSDDKYYGGIIKNGVEAGRRMTRKCANNITLKVITDENSIKLSTPLGR